ncbi:extracellular solute-binding protein [Nocardia sp. ET3-3]|uniref:Extracellular solute-binding protein n=1 Tax=Nocardia terrae TaxID=2675851 RepID=A0A7K1UUU7_9NOCA|nr:extracellular solute-binding protein [Nocardia terrae]MVU78095.1 extracellular solute-binding protein [Nocardia terrae]
MNKALAALAVLLAGVLALTACSGSSSNDKVLRIWHYEAANSAMGLAWDQAIKDFQAAHPEITVRFESKSFEQVQKTAPMILNSADAPDVMEYNKSNASAGLLAHKGLLTDLTPAVQKYGWDKSLTGPLAVTGRYDTAGVMGSGNWYGISDYGEFAMVYYNKDLFAQNNIPVPTTFDELVRAMDAFVAKGITPFANAGSEYVGHEYLYQLALTKADRAWVDAYQRYTGKVDFHDPIWSYAVNTFTDWVKKGYIAKDSAGLKAEDAGNAFEQKKFPMILSGSWWFGRFQKEITFDWGTFLFPGSKLIPGSGGNLWVVPKKSKHSELATEFIDFTMRKQVQNLLGNNGGVPIAADPAAITDPKSQQLISTFTGLSAADGLAYYPDWPAAGFYDVLSTQVQKLLSGSASADQVQSDLQKAYDSGIPKR